jgi:hypothetical protein
MASSVQIVVFCLLSMAVPAFASNQIYRYTDESGTLNFTTEWYSIPEKYRSKAVPLEPEASPPAESLKAVQQPVLRVVTSSSEFRMGDHDTRIDATRMAIEDAKRQALEQAATYLESVTEVKNLDVTRDEIRSYTAGIVTVLNQQTSTRLEDGVIVIHVDLTAQVDEHEVIQAIATLRENESAKQELVSLRAETDQLRQQLDAANQALSTANTPEQVQALTLQRQQLLNQMQADALVAEALAGYAYVTPARVKQINELLSRAKQLHPSNPHLPAAEQPGGPFIAPSPRSPLATPLPQSPLTTPLPPSPLATPLPQSPLATPLPQSPLATPLPQSPLVTPLAPSPLAKPLPPSPLAAPLGPSPLAAPLLPPTIHQTFPPHLEQPNPPVPRTSFYPRHSGGGDSGSRPPGH